MYTSSVLDQHAGVKLPGSHVVCPDILRAANCNNHALSDSADEGTANKPVKSDTSVSHSSTLLLTKDDKANAPKEVKWRRISVRPTTLKTNQLSRAPTARPVKDDKSRPPPARHVKDDKPRLPTARHVKDNKPRPPTASVVKDDKPRPPTARHVKDDKPRPATSRVVKDDEHRPQTARPIKNDMPLRRTFRHMKADKPRPPTTRPVKPRLPTARPMKDNKPRPPTASVVEDDKPRPPTARHVNDDKPRPTTSRAVKDDEPRPQTARPIKNDMPRRPTFRHMKADKPRPPTTRPVKHDKPRPPTVRPVKDDTPRPSTARPTKDDEPHPQTANPINNGMPRPTTARPMNDDKPRPPTTRPLNDDKPRPPTVRPVKDNKPRPPTARAMKDDKPRPPTARPVKDDEPRPPTARAVKDDTPRPPTVRPVKDDKTRPPTAIAVKDDKHRPPSARPVKGNKPRPPTARAVKDDTPRPPTVRPVKDDKIRPPTARPVKDDKPRPPTARAVKDDKPRPPTARPVKDDKPRPPTARGVKDDKPRQPTARGVKDDKPRPSTARHVKDVKFETGADKEPADILVIDHSTPSSDISEVTPRQTPTNAENRTLTSETEKPAAKNTFGPSDYEVVRSTRKKSGVSEAREKLLAILAAARNGAGVAKDDITVAKDDKITEKADTDVFGDDGYTENQDKLPVDETDVLHEKYCLDTEDATAYIERAPVQDLMLEYIRWRAILVDMKLQMMRDEKLVDRHWEWYMGIQEELEATIGEIVKNVKSNMAAMVELERAATKAVSLGEINDQQGALNATEQDEIVEIIKRTNIEDDIRQAYKENRLDKLIRRIRGTDTLDAMHETLKLSQELNKIRDEYNEATLQEETSDVNEDEEDAAPMTPRIPMKPDIDDLGDIKKHRLADDNGLRKFMKYREEMEASMKARKLKWNHSSAAPVADVQKDDRKVEKNAMNIKTRMTGRTKVRILTNGEKMLEKMSREADILIIHHSHRTPNNTTEMNGIGEMKKAKHIHDVTRSTMASRGKVQTMQHQNIVKDRNVRSYQEENSHKSTPAKQTKVSTIKLPRINKTQTVTNDTHTHRKTHSGGLRQPPSTPGCLLPTIPTADNRQEPRPTTGRKNDSADTKLPPIQKPDASRRHRY